QAIDRVSSRFTASTRAVTFVAALLVAGALQVDTIGLVNRLSADDKLREAFVTRAASIQGARSDAAPAQAADAAGAPPATEAIDLQYMAFLADNGLLTAARTRA